MAARPLPRDDIRGAALVLIGFKAFQWFKPFKTFGTFETIGTNELYSLTDPISSHLRKTDRQHRYDQKNE
jgi:hypothetical protein